MQQDNVVLRYIDAMQGNRAALAGFCAVLTDYIGNESHGGVPYPSFYNKLTQRKITGTPGPWPTMDDEDNERKAAFHSFMTKLGLPSGDAARTSGQRSGTKSDAFSGYSSGKSERAASSRGKSSRSSSRGGGGGSRRR